MKILVINCGSSSLKYQLFNMDNEEVLSKGLVERIGIEGSRINHSKTGIDKIVIEASIPDHAAGIKLVLDALLHPEHGSLNSLDELSAVGHRVVHAGEKFAFSVKLTEEVINALRECVPLAPLHNPANIMGIEAVTQALPNIPQVGIFDTAFHQTMPKHAYIYGIPYEYYEKYRIRRYGFHGTSHFYVANRTAEILGKPIGSLKIVTCHLGNGSSIAAVNGGKSVDTTMGFTPLPGILMGTRCGDIDSAIIPFLVKTEGKDVFEIDSILNKKSGIHGISGVSSDMRDIEEAMDKGNERAKLAFEMLAYCIRKQIGAYAAAMGGIDAVVFTAGIGENDCELRASVCKGLEFMGISVDPSKNDKLRGKEKIISHDGTKVAVMVVPTNEELVIARDTKRLYS
jgi:acetate kinase